METGYAIVLSTTASEKEAEALAEKILNEKFAACVQIQKIKSFYPWKSKIERAEEHLLIIKTRADLFIKLSEFIKRNHNYEIPEIIQIPIANGSKLYLDWIADAIR